MSQDFNDPEIFSDFIIESKEHLETIEPNLLELEKAPENTGLLNEIFRPMHSLKGASGFMGLNRINTLAHRAENVLDELRKGTMSVTSEIMDVILSATDALRQMIDNLESNGIEGDVETESIIARLDAIMAGEMPKQAQSAPDAPKQPAAAPTEAPVATSPAAGEAPVAASPAPAAAVSTTAPASDSASTPADWIASRVDLAPYTLTSFGQEHLKDFIDEARENVANISDGLLKLERNPGEHDEIVNNTFRYFHNIKGNSGIIGYQDVNKLTHEAETLLNLVRKDEMPVSSSLVDLLLLVSDVLDKLFSRINMQNGEVMPFDTSELISKLQQAIAGGLIELPGVPEAGAVASAPAAPAPVADHSDLETFDETVGQQFISIKTALKGLKDDGSATSLADALYRSLVTVQNSSSYMGFDEIKVYAERTAGIVDQGRKTDMDFGILVDLLEQECSIIEDMVIAAVNNAKAAASATVSPAPVAAAPAAPKTETQTAPKDTTQAAPAETKPESQAVVPTKPAAPAAEAQKAEGQESAGASTSSPAAAAAKAAPAAKASGKDETSKVSSTIRVDHEKLDHLMQLIGELIINRNRYSMIARDLDTKGTIDVAKVAQDLAETTYSMGRISDDLQDTIMKVRMVPVSSVFSRFPRLVRDLSRKKIGRAHV